MDYRSSVRVAALAFAVAGLAACSDTTQPQPLSDTEITADVAVASGDAIAVDVSALIANEMFGGMAAAGSAVDSMPMLNFTRSRTCYDQAGVVQAQCDQATTASMRIAVTMSGTRTGEHFTGSVHRTRTDSISGLLGTETSRTHNGTGTSADTSTWSGERGTRVSGETTLDSVVAVVFNLPRATNPWPVSGRVVRIASGTVTVTGARDGTRSYQRRVEVVFPADAQGNVTLHVNDKTCTLNLVTRLVRNCS